MSLQVRACHQPTFCSQGQPPVKQDLGMMTTAADPEEDDTVIFNSSDSEITLTPEDDEQHTSAMVDDRSPSLKSRFKQALRIAAVAPQPPAPSPSPSSRALSSKVAAAPIQRKGILKRRPTSASTTSVDTPIIHKSAVVPGNDDDDGDDDKSNAKTAAAEAAAAPVHAVQTAKAKNMARRYRFIHRFWRAHQHPGRTGGGSGEPKVRYSKKVMVHPTYSRNEYNREPDPCAACMHLTPESAHEIRSELNVFKSNEMQVHPASRVYTHFLI